MAWVLTAGQDGRVVVWDATSRRPVHVGDLGAPVPALAAEPSELAVVAPWWPPATGAVEAL